MVIFGHSVFYFFSRTVLFIGPSGFGRMDPTHSNSIMCVSSHQSISKRKPNSLIFGKDQLHEHKGVGWNIQGQKILKRTFNEVNSHDWINMTENCLEYDQKIMTMKNLTNWTWPNFDNDERYRLQLNMTEKYIVFMTMTNLSVEFDRTIYDKH